jgi:ribosomal protein L13E
LQNAFVKEGTKGRGCRKGNVKGFVVAVTVDVRRKSGNVMNIDNRKKRSVNLLKNSRQRVMKAILEG